MDSQDTAPPGRAANDADATAPKAGKKTTNNAPKASNKQGQRSDAKAEQPRDGAAQDGSKKTSSQKASSQKASSQKASSKKGVGKPTQGGGGRKQRGAAGQGDDAKGASNDGPSGADDDRNPVELPERIREGTVRDRSVEEQTLVRRPQIGDTMPMPKTPPPGPAQARGDNGGVDGGDGAADGQSKKKRRKRGGRGRGAQNKSTGRDGTDNGSNDGDTDGDDRGERDGSGGKGGRRRGGRRKSAKQRETEAALREQRSGRERNGKPIGRNFMCVQVRPGVAQVAVLEGRNLIEHYVSRPADDISQIHGNIYLGRVQNVLPGMEAAFVDITTPKNAVLYRGDVQYDPADIEESAPNPRIEDLLRARQMIMCQVTKNPIGAKGARLTQEVSLPGRFVVLIPNSKTYGISKRLPDNTRKRLREILDRLKPAEHGLIVRTAAEHATEDDLKADLDMLAAQWNEIERKAAKAKGPALLYREPELAVRVIREEFNPDYRGVAIDDKELYEEVKAYVEAFNPELADRVEYYDSAAHNLTLFEKHHVHEQVHKALDRKVWLPSGGSLIIEHTEALTVIDVNTGKNVGKSNLEETVFHNNMEAAEEVAKQLRLRDIGGIVVIDFIDMEIKDNRAAVANKLRECLARDKTRTQVFDIGELGLVEMTRKRIGEGLLTEFSEICPDCDGRGVLVDHTLLD